MAIRAPSIRRALDDALRSHPIPVRAEALVALAKRLASEIDAAGEKSCPECDRTMDPELVVKLAPRYQAALEGLGMTMAKPAAAGVTPGGSGERSALDELKARRARLRDPSAVDSATEGSV
jgi:hypothetical protein